MKIGGFNKLVDVRVVHSRFCIGHMQADPVTLVRSSSSSSKLRKVITVERWNVKILGPGILFCC